MGSLLRSSSNQNSQSIAANALARRHKRRRSPLILFLFILLWCTVLGVGLAQAKEPGSLRPVPEANISADLSSADLNLAQANSTPIQSSPQTSSTPQASPIGTVDPVPEQFQLGQQLYLENCATCHVGLPPQVFPNQTWANVIQNSDHYGVQLTPLVDPTRFLIWNYLRAYSRRLLERERVPYLLGESRYFKALHPRVELPRTVNIGSCISCHPGVGQYNFRELSPEWQNAP